MTEMKTPPEAQAMPDKPTCPFCKRGMTPGLTKKTGCQLHGDPIQYVTLSCSNQFCRVRPSITGGCAWRGGDKPIYKKEEDAKLAKQWIEMVGEKSTITAQLKAGDDVVQQVEAVKNQIKMVAFTSAGHDNEVMKMCAVWAGTLEKALASYASVREGKSV